ncbi:phage tail family protein [Bacillus sp. MMSF_3328]|uniref:phage tail family protein n=1 Tax=Bacillus sp. MMSF_3328 TaxID=3047080 RepID=UPI00273F59FE|nr:phage tail family protein [Bacillus sp. MMSF_3328]
MQKFTFINANNESVVLKNSGSYVVEDVSGLGDVDSNIQSQKAPDQDGDTYTGSNLEPRYLSFDINIIGLNRADTVQKRTKLGRVFNPTLGPGRLIVENEMGTREIEAVSEHVPKYPQGRGNKGATFQKALINLKAPDPYWLERVRKEQMVVWEGGLEFPLSLPTFFAQQSENKAKILQNDGEVPTSVRIIFNGPATAPIRIINVTTGDFIEVNQSLTENERLEINTTPGQKSVRKIQGSGESWNAFHFIHLGSTFFRLIPGNNLLDYSTGADYERAAVSIAWHNRFTTV